MRAAAAKRRSGCAARCSSRAINAVRETGSCPSKRQNSVPRAAARVRISPAGSLVVPMRRKTLPPSQRRSAASSPGQWRFFGEDRCTIDRSFGESVHAAYLPRRITDLSRRIADLSRRIADSSRRIADPSRRIADLSRRIADLSRRIAELSRRVAAEGSVSRRCLRSRARYVAGFRAVS